MANLISCATGNFTTSTTWGAVEAVSELDSESGTSAVSTSNVDSSSFVPASSTIDGLALKLSARAASPTGTFTIKLRNSTTSTDAATVTVNVSDLHASGKGWFFFKFGSTVSPNGTDSYIVRLVCSNTGSQVTLYTNGGTNWSRKLRTTTNQAPAANNHLVICSELTGAGTSNALTVTLDNTATTTFGPTVSGGPPQGIVVSGFGTFICGTAASTNYYLKWKGIFLVSGGGVVSMGSSGTRLPSTSTLVLEMAVTSNFDTWIDCNAGGSFYCYGATKTVRTQLTVDAAASANSFTVGDTTGWLATDKIGFTPTTTNWQAFERLTVNAVGSSTTFSTTTNATYAHAGTGIMIGYCLNMTRNIVIRAITARGRLRQTATSLGSSVILSYVEFTPDNLGDSSNGGIDIQTTAPSTFLMEYSSCNPGSNNIGNNQLMIVSSGSNCDNFTISHHNSFDWRRCHFLIGATSGTAWVIDSCFALGSVNGELHVFYLKDTGGTFTNNIGMVAAQFQSAIFFSENDGSGNIQAMDKTRFSGNEGYYASNGMGITFAANQGYGISISVQNLKTCRNGYAGVAFAGTVKLAIIDTLVAFGNSSGTQGGCISFRTSYGNAVFYGYNLTFDSDPYTASGVGMTNDQGSNGGSIRCFLYSSKFSCGASPLTQMAQDFYNNYPGAIAFQIFANNCKFSSTALMQNLTAAASQASGDHIDGAGSFVRAQDWGQTAGDHRTYLPQGVIQTDSVVYHTAAPAQKLTPNTASYKLRSGRQTCSVVNTSPATARTITVWVRKSKASTGDSADYNGAQPRLVVRKNDAVGITADTVLATASAATGTWEQLSGTIATPAENGVVEVYVDCDGTTGFVSIDDYGIA